MDNFHLNIKLNYIDKSVDVLDQITALSKKHPGNYKIVLHLISKLGKSQKVLLSNIKINCDSSSLSELRSLLGADSNVWLSTV